MSSPDVDDVTSAMAAEGKAVRRDLRQTMLSGLALTVPFFITVLVLVWTLNTVSGALSPLREGLLSLGFLEGTSEVLVDAVAGAIVLGIVFVVGFAAQHGPDTQVGSRIDVLMEDIPGIGSIYSSVERMSGVLLEGDTDSFREVRLVEFPHEESFAIGFLTAGSPELIEAAAGREDLITVYVPLAPNPVMGGHLLNLPPDRVHDIDLTVEEGMEAIVTTGITVDASARDETSDESGGDEPEDGRTT